MPGGEEVIELSVEETNKLRAELGLAPLRLDDASTPKDDRDDEPPKPKTTDEVLEMSVDETNKLRESLGLPPLRTGASSSKSKIQDAKLKEKQLAQEEAQAEQQAQLEDDVEKGIATTFTATSLGVAAAEGDVNSWAAKLRQTKEEKAPKKKKKKSKTTDKQKYDQDDLKGMNVAHAVSELEAGSTTVMTLADAPLLETKESNPHIVTGLNQDANTPQLENIQLTERHKQADGLRKKRQLEMGMGRAGGYAGFDDDEFEELGGTGAPSRAARGDNAGGGEEETHKKARKGFLIGDTGHDKSNNKANQGSDLFAMESGQAISLEPGQADVQASDFMTEQEDLEARGKDKKKKSKRKDKFDKKKKKKKDKKERKKHRRRQQEEEEDEESEDEAMPPAPAGSSGKSLLDELEETAEASTANSNNNKKSRKRSREDNDNEEENGIKKENEDGIKREEVPSAPKLVSEAKKEDKRAKYDLIMDKGNARTKQAFAAKTKKTDDAVDEEPDDAFLNAALAKARRLKKLRGMNAAPAAKGAEAVAQAVKSMPETVPSTTSAAAANGVTFSIDDTREFTRALRARTEQQSRQQTKAAAKKDAPSANTITTMSTKQEDSSSSMQVETVKQEDDDGDNNENNNNNNNNNGTEDVDMAELAKEIKDDEDETPDDLLDGTGTAVALGRGMAGALNMFKKTGDLTRKNAGMEKLRGRAKDERNYEDYQALDLKQVVKIDSRYATEKDKEMASREVKLEYRDKNGRLLTKKAAFRDLCYQFHGHGSSKRKEELRQRQMAAEEAEGRLASQQLGGAGTLGALKATQKATGKAFVVHKT